MKNASDYIREDGPGQRTITSLAYWLTPEGINPFTAEMVRKAIDKDSDADFAEAYDGASKDDARTFLDKWELCHMPYWSGEEIARAISLSESTRSAATALRAITLAQHAGELGPAFTPRQGVQWAMARGYMLNRDICQLVGVQPGQYGHPHNPLDEAPLARNPSGAGATETFSQGANAASRSPTSAPRKTPSGGDSLTPLIWIVCYDLHEAGKNVTASPVMAELKALASKGRHPLVGAVAGGVAYEFEKGDERELNAEQLRKRIGEWKSVTGD